MTNVHRVFGEPHNLRTIFTLRGNVDEAAVPDLRRELTKFAATTTGDVVVDCRDLISIDAAGASLLLAFHNDLLGFARRVSVRRIPAGCRETFEANHLSALLGEPPSKRSH